MREPFANSPDNNGNVLRQLHYVPLSGGGYVLPQLDDYTYDEVNRIKSVTEAQLNSSGGWTFNLFTQNFNYDRWGNRTVSCSPCQPGVTGDVFTIDTATNRITAKNGTGMTYDLAGNQTYDATGNRWFDGENRMNKATQGGTTSHYVYDADGKRVRRIIGSTETWMIYGIDGELVAEYAAAASATSPQKEYGYRSGQMLIAAETSPLKITWLVTDHLGSPRMNIRGTGTDGGSLASVTRHDYLPFGEDLIAGIRVNGGTGQYGYEPPPDGVRQKFTGKERDNETGLDYFGARSISSTQARFISPDPLLNSGRPNLPQSWNRYTYTLNNPLKYIDPDGLYEWGASLGGDKQDDQVSEEIRRKRELFKAALAKDRENLETVRKTFGESSDEYKNAKLAVDIYGNLGDKNKVFVGVGTADQEDAGMTRSGSKGNIYVTFKEDVFNNAAADSKGFQSLISHEGWHVDEIKNGVTGGDWKSEYGAVFVQAAMGAALYPNGRNYFTIGTGADQKQAVIWNSSWAEADRVTERDKGIKQYLQAPKSEGGKGLTPPKN